MARWLEDARALGSQHLVAVLVGNKSDREEEREVEWAEASRWAAEHGEVTCPRLPRVTAWLTERSCVPVH